VTAEISVFSPPAPRPSRHDRLSNPVDHTGLSWSPPHDTHPPPSRSSSPLPILLAALTLAMTAAPVSPVDIYLGTYTRATSKGICATRLDPITGALSTATPRCRIGQSFLADASSGRPSARLDRRNQAP